MNIYIAVVSHGHRSLLKDLDCLPSLAKHDDISVVVLDNINDDGLRNWCLSNSLYYIGNSKPKGFGENNNSIFNWCEDKLNLEREDYFLLLNPDVFVECSSVLKLVERAKEQKSHLSTLNLYKDSSFSIYDPCVRDFPSFIDFFSSYLGMGNKTILGKSSILSPREVDWAAGSFILFKASLFQELSGFDSGYFMYCEDIDICWRANKLLKKKLMFYPDIKAIHYAQHANRSLFSMHFVWHVKSMFRYLTMFYGLRKPSPCVRVVVAPPQNG